MIGENHIDTIHYDYTSYNRTKSMVIDFKFPHASDGWISLIYNKAFDKSGANFSDYQEIDLWVKYISDNSDDTIDIKLGIGKFNEDIDHDDAPLEEEANEYSDGSKRVILETPDLPLIKLPQNSSFPIPIGVTAPIPVITTFFLSVPKSIPHYL